MGIWLFAGKMFNYARKIHFAENKGVFGGPHELSWYFWPLLPVYRHFFTAHRGQRQHVAVRPWNYDKVSFLTFWMKHSKVWLVVMPVSKKNYPREKKIGAFAWFLVNILTINDFWWQILSPNRQIVQIIWNKTLGYQNCGQKTTRLFHLLSLWLPTPLL